MFWTRSLHAGFALAIIIFCVYFFFEEKQQHFMIVCKDNCSNRKKEYVCGSDGITYDNMCVLDCTSQHLPDLQLAHLGVCEKFKQEVIFSIQKQKGENVTTEIIKRSMKEASNNSNRITENDKHGRRYHISKKSTLEREAKHTSLLIDNKIININNKNSDAHYKNSIKSSKWHVSNNENMKTSPSGMENHYENNERFTRKGFAVDISAKSLNNRLNTTKSSTQRNSYKAGENLLNDSLNIINSNKLLNLISVLDGYIIAENNGVDPIGNTSEIKHVVKKREDEIADDAIEKAKIFQEKLLISFSDDLETIIKRLSKD